MGFFDGLFSKKKNVDFDIHGFDSKLPRFLQESGREIGTGAFDFFRDQIQSGETPQETQLFSRSRSNTIKGFGDAVLNAGLDLNRFGIGSSGFRDKTLAALALGLGDILTRQDAQRARELLSRRSGAASQGLNAALATSGASTLTPIFDQPGLFEGFGTGLISGGLNLGASALGGSFFGGGGGATAPTNIRSFNPFGR